MRFVSTSFQQSSSFYARTSGSFSGSLISSSFYISSTTDLGGFNADFGTKKVTYIIPSGSTGGNSDVKALLISASGINPRVGIGVDNPLKAFDFKNISDTTRGGELLIRGSRTTKGAEIGDEAGRINFAIDSGSYNKVDISGSTAEIVALVEDVDVTGVLGSLSFRASEGKTAAPQQILKIIGDGSLTKTVEVTGSAEFSKNITAKEDLIIGGKIDSFITASSGISASGDIETSGDVIATNFVVSEGGSLKTVGSGEYVNLQTDQIALGFGSSWSAYFKKGEGFIFNDLNTGVVGENLVRDFRVKGLNDSKLLFASGGDATVGIGTDTPTEKLTVSGSIAVTGTVDGVDIATLKSDFDTLKGKTLVSESAQIAIGSTTGTITSAKISDVDAFSQTGTYASLRAQGTTADDVGLGNVTNESKATMFTSPTFTGTVAIPGFADVSASLAAAVAGGDNLGNHTATQNLNMGTYAITNVGNVDGVDVSALKSDFDTLEGKTLVSESAQIDLGSATGTAANALTASYVAGSNVDGIVTFSSLATTAINATNATNIDVNNVSGNTEYGLVFRDGNGDGNQALYADSETDQPSYNPSTNTIKTPIISASSALYVGGNITVTGTVDGADIATLDSNFSILKSKTLVSESAQIDLSLATGTAANATNATNVNIGNADGSSTYFLIGSLSTGNQALKRLITYNDSTDTLSTTNITVTSNVSASGIITTDDYRFGNRKFATPSPFDSAGISFGNGGDANISLTNITASGNVDIQGILSIPGFPNVSASLASSGGGGGGGISFNGSTTNGVLTYGDSTTADVESNLIFNSNTLQINASNTAGAYITINSAVYGSANPYISPDGLYSTLRFGSSATGKIFDFQNNKIAFDNDATNTYIQANTDVPEDLEIHADQDIILAADNAVVIGAVTDVEDRISSYRVQLQSMGFYGQNSLRYLTFNTTGETTGFNYISIIPAPASGRLISITAWPQSSAGSTIMGFHVNSNATAASTDTQTLTAGSPATFTFSSGNTFSALDELSFSINPTNNPNGLSFSIILEYDY